MSDWHLYMLRCNDNSLYTGITIDVERRVDQHSRGDGARYLRGRAPLTLVFTSFVLDHSDALR
ncbi:GIY-YIG nuclease family protein, partial [Myxococcota bacterium]|nr:GIY-YIG nuclease family protein [Myxococcota bacterium]